MSGFDDGDPRLESPNSLDRFAATADLEKKLLPSHGPLLLRMLKDPESGLRIRACTMLMRLGNPDCLPEIARLLDDPWYGCRSWAIRCLLKVGGAYYLPRVVTLADDPHIDVKTTVLDAIVEHRAVEHAERLLPLLKVPDCYLDIRTAEALCNLTGNRYLPQIVRLLRSGGDNARSRVLSLLGEYGVAGYEEAVVKLTGDRHVGGNATLLLAQHQPDLYEGRLIDWLERAPLEPGTDDDGQFHLLVQAMRLLSASGRDGSRRPIARLLAHSRARIAARAALCLARLSLKDHQEAVRKLALSEDTECSLAASIALLRDGRLARSQQLELLEAVLHWRENEPRTCLRSSIDLELRDEILDALLQVQAPEMFRRLSEPRVLDRDIETPGALQGPVEQCGLTWAGADDGIKFSKTLHRGLNISVLDILERGESTGVVVPVSNGVTLATPDSAVARWRSLLRG